MVDPERAQALFRALSERGVDYVLVGATAMDVHGMGRFTEDIDFFVRPTAVNIESLRAALHDVWEDPSIEEVSAEDLAGPYPVVRYVAPDGAQIDFIARLEEAFQFEDLESEVILYGEIPVRVATPRTLFLMKRDTIRLQDRADADRIRRKFRLED